MTCDVAVIGAGIVGLGVAYELAQAGCEVACLDPAPAAAQSAGPGRIFRVAQSTAEAVVQASAALRGWHRWSGVAGHPLVDSNGAVVAGEDASTFARAMEEAGEAFRWFSEDELSGVVPAAFERGHRLLLDERGGTIDAEATVRWLIAELGDRLIRERVVEIVPAGDRVQLRTDRRELEARRLVIAAGVDTQGLAHELGFDIAQRTFRHVRYAVTGEVADAGWTACFLDRRRATASGWSHYGVPLEGNTLAVGSAWGEAPFPVDAVSQSQVRDRALAELHEWVTSVGDGSAFTVVGTVDCTYPRYVTSTAPFAVRHSGPVTVVTGEELFKFAPLIAQRVGEFVRERDRR